jgi:hypothetical protein
VCVCVCVCVSARVRVWGRMRMHACLRASARSERTSMCVFVCGT